MTGPIIPRDLVARELAVSQRILLRYEQLGLVHAARTGAEEGYEPAQIRRLWTIVSFQRDLGVNLAGIEVILRLFDQLARVHRHVGGLAEQLLETLEEASEVDESPTATISDG
jgi:MerR family transcriptional regulator/heat shock protein HspR